MRWSLRKGQSSGQLRTSLAWLRAHRSRGPQFSDYASRDEVHRDRQLDAEVRHLLTLGRYFSAFDVEHTDWLIRRVDTSELQDSIAGSSSIRSSLMIDGVVVREIMRRAGFRGTQIGYLPLPAQGKRVLGRFDARMGDYSIPVVPRMDNAHAAVGVLLTLLMGKDRAAVNFVTGKVIDALYQLATCDAGSREGIALASQFSTVTSQETIRNLDNALVETDEGTNSPITELSLEVVSAPDEVLDLVIVILDLIVEVRQRQGEDRAVELTQALDYYLKNFVPIGIFERLPGSEFIVKFQVSSNAFEPTPSTYLPRSHSGELRILSSRALWSFAPTFLVAFAVGALLPSSNPTPETGTSIASAGGFIILASVIASTFLLIGTFTALGVKRGFKWTVGAFAYESYLASIQKLIPGLRLSGYYILRCNDTNLGLKGSQHFRLSLPNGVRAIRSAVVDGNGRMVNVPYVQSADWVAAHSDYSHRSPATLSFLVGVIPSTQTFLRHALYAAAVTMSLFGVGLVSHIAGVTLYDGCQPADVVCPDYGLAHLVSRSSGAIVTVLAIAPSIYTIILLQREEHQFASTVYRVMRRVVGVCALASASVAIPLALDLPTIIVIIWWIVGLASAWFSCWHVAATRFYHGALSATLGGGFLNDDEAFPGLYDDSMVSRSKM